MKTAILFGGFSTEHDASVKTFEHIYECVKHEDDALHYALFLNHDSSILMKPIAHHLPAEAYYTKGVKDEVLSLIDALKYIQEKDIFIFSILLGQNGEDGTIQGLAKFLDIRGNFESPLACSLAMSKFHMNQYIKVNYPLNVPKTLRISSVNNLDLTSFEGKEVVVKPNSLGASILTEKLNSSAIDAIKALAKQILEFDDYVLIQEFIEGEEYSVGCLSTQGNSVQLPVVQIFTERGFFGHTEKHKEGKNKEVIIAPSSESSTIKHLRNEAERIFQDFDFQYMARFDFICRGKEIFFLEINPVPGMMKESIFTKMLGDKGISFKKLIEIVQQNNLDNPRKKHIFRYTID